MNFQKVADAVGETVRKQFDAIRKTLSDFSRAMVAIDDRLKAVEARQPERGEKGDAGPQGEPGADGATGARGEDGRPGERGERGEAGIQGARGEPGAKGDPGRDAEPIDIAEVVRELVRCPEIVPIVALQAADAVAKHLETNPVQHGRDGRDGKDGRDGMDGKDGSAGRDGDRGEPGADGKSLTIEDVSVFLDAAVAKHVLDLERRCLDAVTKAIDKIPVPKDGKDGRSVEDFTRSYDADQHEIVERWKDASGSQELRYPAGGLHHKGYWSQGTHAKACESWTHNGTLWIAMRDTTDEPDIRSKDWTIGARKGRDGERGPAGKDSKPTVSVKP